MVELLKILAEWLSFFFIDNRYRLVNSEVGIAYDDALIDLSSDNLMWRLVRDRSQVFLDCRPLRGSLNDQDWFSADLLIRLLTGRRVETAELTPEMAKWFEDNLTEIEVRFSPEHREETVEQLKKLKRIRAKDLFDDED